MKFPLASLILGFTFSIPAADIALETWEGQPTGFEYSPATYGWTAHSESGDNWSNTNANPVRVVEVNDLTGDWRTYVGAQSALDQVWIMPGSGFTQAERDTGVRISFQHRDTIDSGNEGYRVLVQIDGTWYASPTLSPSSTKTTTQVDLATVNWIPWETNLTDGFDRNLLITTPAAVLPSGDVTATAWLLQDSSGGTGSTFRFDQMRIEDGTGITSPPAIHFPDLPNGLGVFDLADGASLVVEPLSGSGPIVGVTLTLNGTPLTEDTTAPFDFSADPAVTSLSAGWHTVTASARDASNNTDTASATFLISDGSRPQTESEIRYLSGPHRGAAVDWDFYLSPGTARGGGIWSTIPVPSCYETEGFGAYRYADDNSASAQEVATYRHTFSLTASDLQSARILLLFGGVMTDADVSINGQSAGTVHQGAFYAFHHDISDLIQPGDNTLEVVVRKVSQNGSIDDAERITDFWLFGGIFRPVWLELLPPRHIERVLLAGDMNGNFEADVHLGATTGADTVAIQLLDAQNAPVGSEMTVPVSSAIGGILRISGSFPSAALWSTENPNLYTARVELRDGATLLHRVEDRFGFRTFDILNQSGQRGAFLNGNRILIQGMNRHTFRPHSGRSITPAETDEDIALLKELNVNLVRSHVPADPYFMERLDEEGILHISEVTAWTNPHTTVDGTRLTRQHVWRDHNYASNVLWINGNHNAWNPDLEGVFYQYDLQDRRVLGVNTRMSSSPIQPTDPSLIVVDTRFYPSWNQLSSRLTGPNPVFPCEALHALYDAGGGAGLEQYWNAMEQSDYAVGLVFWAMHDEALVRDDDGGRLDNVGNRAADGIVGPYLEKEPSYWTLRQIWSPVQIVDPTPSTFTGNLTVENRWIERNLNQAFFTWTVLDWDGEDLVPRISANQSGPNVLPGATGTLSLSGLPDLSDAAALKLTAFDPDGNPLRDWVWSWKAATDHWPANAVTQTPATQLVSEEYIVEAGGNVFHFSETGLRLNIGSSRGRDILLSNGPDRVWKTGNVSNDGSGNRDNAPATGTVTVTPLTDAVELAISNVRGLDSLIWTVFGDGSLQLNYSYSVNGSYDFHGVTFDWDDTLAKLPDVSWLGHGPDRVWGNRTIGPLFGHWTKDNANQVPGVDYDYPHFRGYHGPFRLLRLNRAGRRVQIYSDGTIPWFRLGTPDFGEDTGGTEVHVPFPQGEFSLLHDIPGVGTKWYTRGDLGPGGLPDTSAGTFSGSVLFRFGSEQPELGAWQVEQFTHSQLADDAQETTTWGETADPNSDGVSNEHAFALGAANPTETLSSPEISLLNGAPQFRRRAGLGYSWIQPQVSTDLINWTNWSPAPTAITPGSGNEEWVTLPMPTIGDDPVFIRTELP